MYASPVRGGFRVPHGIWVPLQWAAMAEQGEWGEAVCASPAYPVWGGFRVPHGIWVPLRRTALVEQGEWGEAVYASPVWGGFRVPPGIWVPLQWAAPGASRHLGCLSNDRSW